MSKQQHTPGPWFASNYGDYYEHGTPGMGRLILAGAGKEISVAVVEGPDTPENAADARLIAAAPDLLAALKDLERTAGQAAMFDDPVRVAARAAIARAEGKA